MAGLYSTPMSTSQRHKVFVSYYHDDDEYYRTRFDILFGGVLINKSVEPGDIDEDLSTNYIKRLLQLDYISDTSVVVVLVGQRTYLRKHVDWEISAGVNFKVGGYSGLVGILLPSYPGYSENQYHPETILPRLNDNVDSGYDKLHWWTEDVMIMRSA